ncbi:MAG: hypothetical protein SFU86_08550 [Pirellulaceae bacterium]|nr:hypothetical protein [Pirellulaceae bacterium]
MQIPAQSEQPRPVWQRIRFSLGGLLTGIFGLACALAYSRLESTTWSERLLAGYLGLFVVGMGQMAWQAFQLWKNRPAGLPRDSRFALLLGVLWPLASVGAIALATTADLARNDKSAPEPVNDMSKWWVQPGLIQALLFLAIIGGYARPPRQTWRGAGALSPWNVVFAVVAVGLGGFWIAVLAESQLAHASLIHLAIRSIHLNSPKRWLGRDFLPDYVCPQLEREFIYRGLLAGILAAAAFGLLVGFACAWRRPRMIRAAWLLAWIGSVAAIGWLMWWCGESALPVISPVVAPQILTHPATCYLLGVALIVFASGILAYRLSAKPIGEIEQPIIPTTDAAWLPVHRRTPVMGLLLVATAWGAVETLGESLSLKALLGLSEPWSVRRAIVETLALVELPAITPYWTMRLAAIILVSQQLWITWRKKGKTLSPSYSIDPWKFSLTALLATITGLFIVPAVAWFGVARFFWAGLP